MSSEKEVCNFFRKPTTTKNIRKRQTHHSSSSSSEEQQEETTTAHPQKHSRKTPSSNLHFSSSKPKPESQPDTNTTLFHFESSKQIQVQTDSRATATLETETDFSNDSRAIRERVLNQSKAKPTTTNNNTNQLYKGINAYTDYKAGFRREQTISAEKAGGAHGPLRASAHIRTSMRFDYQPDICKDYKETGYCGFGDACKFMHDRGDYKSGWQMEKEWEEKERNRKRALALGELGEDGGSDGDEEEEDEDALPFACFVCRRPFESPVVTKCKHYFCEHCALKHHSTNKKCFVCNKPTLGIFNTAHEILKRMAQEKKTGLD